MGEWSGKRERAQAGFNPMETQGNKPVSMTQGGGWDSFSLFLAYIAV